MKAPIPAHAYGKCDTERNTNGRSRLGGFSVPRFPEKAFGMTGPSVTVARAFGLLVLVGAFLAVSVVAYFVMLPAPTEKPVTSRPAEPRIEKVNYEVLISREKNAAAEATRRAQVQYEASVKRRIAAHASETVNIADQAADHAAELKILTKTIYYLASDKALGKKESDQYLQEQIGPIVEPGLQAISKGVSEDFIAFDHEVRRITVQLATNIAAIGPGTQPAPPRVVPPAAIGAEFSKVVMGLGGKFAHVGVDVGSTVIFETVPKTMITKVSQMCAGIALRLFGKQVAKLVSSAMIGTATGPLEIVVLVGSVIWTGYDVIQERKKYRDEVHSAIKTQLDDADQQIESGAVNYFARRAVDFLSIQTSIATKALEDIQKREPK